VFTARYGLILYIKRWRLVFNNRGGKCLQRGTDWLKPACFVREGLNKPYLCWVFKFAFMEHVGPPSANRITWLFNLSEYVQFSITIPTICSFVCVYVCVCVCVCVCVVSLGSGYGTSSAHSVGLLSKSDQPQVGESALQHTALTRE